MSCQNEKMSSKNEKMSLKNLAKYRLPLLSFVLGGFIVFAAGDMPGVLAKDAAGELADMGVNVKGDPEFEKALLKHIEKRLFERINANEEQQTKIATLIESKLEGNRGKRQSLKEGFKEFIKLSQSADANDDEIRAKAKELRAMHEALMDDRLDTFLSIRGMLDADQRAKLGNKILERMSSRSGMGGRFL